MMFLQASFCATNSLFQATLWFVLILKETATITLSDPTECSTLNIMISYVYNPSSQAAMVVTDFSVVLMNLTDFNTCFSLSAKKKAYTTTTERKSFGELFWPQRKTFQAGGGYKNPIKTRKTISTTKIFPLWSPFFSAKRSSALEQGGVRFIFPSLCRKTHTDRFLHPSFG